LSRLREQRVTTGADGLRVDVKRLDPDMPLPEYAHSGDAGIDLHAREDAFITRGGGRVLMPTGIAIAIPLGWAGFVLPRSGLALKHGISVVNSPGLIDSAYRGELKVVLINTDPAADYEITRGDRIAQLVLQRVGEVTWNEVAELSGDDRGGGFGHSGR
jgi:dUTP pyrophosphatase